MKIVLVIVAAFVAGIVCVDAQNLKQTRLYEDNNFQFADNITYQLDSVYSFTTSNDNWSIYSRKKYSYKDSFLLNSLTQQYNNSVWQNIRQENYSYSDNNSQWSKEELTWNKENSQWKQIRKRDFSIDENNGKIDILYSEMDTNSAWNNKWQQSQYYNQNGNLLSYQTIKWDSRNNKWESYWDYNCYYDDNNRLLQTTHKSFNKDNQNWAFKWECINDYKNDNLVSEQIINWNSNNDEWNSMQLINVSYPNSNTIIKIKKSWSNDINDWINSSRITEYYENNGQLTKTQTDFWDNNNQIWINQQMDLYQYNDAGIKTEQQTAYWNSTTSSWINNLKKEYYYSQLIYPKEETTEGSELLIYPNPAEYEIYLKFEGSARSLNIYNTRGEKVMQINDPLMGQSINISKLKNGVYIAVIKYNNSETQCKFVKK